LPRKILGNAADACGAAVESTLVEDENDLVPLESKLRRAWQDSAKAPDKDGV